MWKELFLEMRWWWIPKNRSGNSTPLAMPFWTGQYSRTPLFCRVKLEPNEQQSKKCKGIRHFFSSHPHGWCKANAVLPDAHKSFAEGLINSSGTNLHFTWTNKTKMTSQPKLSYRRLEVNIFITLVLPCFSISSFFHLQSKPSSLRSLALHIQPQEQIDDRSKVFPVKKCSWVFGQWLGDMRNITFPSPRPSPAIGRFWI